jgi:hypothetical protein
MLGRTQDMFTQNKEIKEARQTMDLGDGKVLKDAADREAAKGGGRGVKRRKVGEEGGVEEGLVGDDEGSVGSGRRSGGGKSVRSGGGGGSKRGIGAS